MDPLAVVLASLFGTSAAFLTLIGSQTDLMGMDPKRTGLRTRPSAGGPLLAGLTVVTTLGIAASYTL